MYSKNSIRGSSLSLDAKNADFSSKFQKNQASNKGPSTNIEKNRSYLMQKSLEFVTTCEFLVLRLHLPPMKVPHYIVFDPTFIFARKYRPLLASCEPRIMLCLGKCIFKVLSICLLCQLSSANSLRYTSISRWQPLPINWSLTFLAFVASNKGPSP